MATSRPLINAADLPEQWPPTEDEMEQVLLDVFSQHVLSARNRVVHRAYETIVEGRPYAHGRVHQRPFVTLDELHLDEAARDKLVDVVAVFVDEAMEQLLALFGAVTNTVGEYDTVSYEVSGQIKHHELPAQVRYSADALHALWQKHLANLLAGVEAPPPHAEADADRAGEAEPPVTPIGRGVPIWFDYRKWLGKYCTFRRTARP